MEGTRERILSLVEAARTFRTCSPSDDPEQQTAVTLGYRYLVTQFKRLVAPLLPTDEAVRLRGINVGVDDLYSVYEAKAELDAMLPVILAVAESATDPLILTRRIVEPSVLEALVGLRSPKVNVVALVRMCNEINLSYAHDNVLATALLMRTVLNHVPPAFGHATFEQVVAQSARSLKEAFEHLQNGLRKIVDFYAHRLAAADDSYPTRAQLEPFKPQFDLLLREIIQSLR